MPVSFIINWDASLLNPLSAFGRSLAFTLCEDKTAGTEHLADGRLQLKPSDSRWRGHMLSCSIFLGGEKTDALILTE